MHRVNTAEAKAHLSALLSEVEKKGEPILIARHGRPVAALISFEDLDRLQRAPVAPEPGGALALVGLWSDVLSDEEIDELFGDIYEQRQRDFGRDVELTQ